MGKATIIEAQNSNTVYEEGNRKGILGRLVGPFADYIHGTRNSDRKYIEELWDKRVFGSEDVMEALETRTLFGELDHPQGDRCETLAQNAAISITKLEKKPDEGIIYGEADILDTPTGRIVKALADSGAKLGISSRGIGEEIYENGENIIDPETYDFITFDVVVTPANTVARVSLTESKHLSKLTESLEREVKECETENQLNQVKAVLESVSIDKKDSILKDINTKLENLQNKQEKTENKLTETNRNLALKLIQEKYTQCNEQLKESLNANTQLASENRDLVKRNEFLKESRDMLKTKIKEHIENTKVNSEETEKLITENKSLVAEQKESKALLESEVKKYKETIARLEKENKAQLDTLKEGYENKIKVLESQNTQLAEINTKLTESVNENSKIILESKTKQQELEQKVKRLESKQVEYSRILTENKKSSSRVAELEAENKSLKETKDRFAKLSFNPLGTMSLKKESRSTTNDMSQDDIDLFNALINK